jgi:hypothetical protein
MPTLDEMKAVLDEATYNTILNLINTNQFTEFITGLFDRAYNFKEVEIDLGGTPGDEFTLTITDADCQSDSIIMAVPSGKPGDGKTEADVIAADLMYKALADSGQFTLYVKSLSGNVDGKFYVNYLIKKGYNLP